MLLLSFRFICILIFNFVLALQTWDTEFCLYFRTSSLTDYTTPSFLNSSRLAQPLTVLKTLMMTTLTCAPLVMEPGVGEWTYSSTHS
jgi:hypothetical protein